MSQLIENTKGSPPGRRGEKSLALAERPVVVIQPGNHLRWTDFADVWRYRELLWMLAERDVRLRYKQAFFGVIWVFLQPLLPAALLALIFGKFARLPSDGQPYVLFVFCGYIVWTLLAGSIQRAGNSLVTDARLISKVYFPRLLIPLGSVLAVAFDFLITMLLLVVLLAAYQVLPTWRLMVLPAFVLHAIITAMGSSLWLSALNVKYRDFMYAMPFLIMLWMYASPIVYPMSIVPESWHWLYGLNPCVGFIEGFRWSILGSSALKGSILLTSWLISLVLLATGLMYFRSTERAFADHL